MTDVDDWAAAIEQQEKEQLTGKVEWCLVWGSPIKNGHDALQSLEAIDMLPVTPTFLVTSRTTHFLQHCIVACPGPNLP